MLKRRLWAMSGLLSLSLALIASPARADELKYVSVKGQVTLTKEVKFENENVDADQKECEKNGKLVKDIVVVDKASKGLKNVVVFIRPDDNDRKKQFPKEMIKPELAKAAPKTHVVDQPCCQFEPRILAVRVGDGLEVKNTSKIAHNINYSGENPFNVNIPAGMAHKMAIPFVAQNAPAPFACNVHRWMGGKIRVFDHPYFAITDKDGKFEIKDLPAGKWRVVYWHENGLHQGVKGAAGFPFEAKAQDATTELKPIDFEFPNP
ncbi:MAG: hypothetical protein ACRC8S_08530 [Fimbriiglobus sp.]